MKKLTVLCSALLLAATSFAGEVTYNLQGVLPTTTDGQVKATCLLHS